MTQHQPQIHIKIQASTHLYAQDCIMKLSPTTCMVAAHAVLTEIRAPPQRQLNAFFVYASHMHEAVQVHVHVHVHVWLVRV